jgi:hypothetical protein
VADGVAFDPMKDGFPHLRVARPPAEGRGRNQLLPRYWPRITDQELQQISGEYPLIFFFNSLPTFILKSSTTELHNT